MATAQLRDESNISKKKISGGQSWSFGNLDKSATLDSGPHGPASRSCEKVSPKPPWPECQPLLGNRNVSAIFGGQKIPANFSRAHLWGPALNPPLQGLKSGEVAHLQTWENSEGPVRRGSFESFEPPMLEVKVYIVYRSLKTTTECFFITWKWMSTSFLISGAQALKKKQKCLSCPPPRL